MDICRPARLQPGYQEHQAGLTVDIGVNFEPPPVRVQEVPPVLKEPVSLAILPWFDGRAGPSGLVRSFPAVEKEVITLASVRNRADLLNIDGRWREHAGGCPGRIKKGDVERDGLSR